VRNKFSGGKFKSKNVKLKLNGRPNEIGIRRNLNKEKAKMKSAEGS